MSNIPVLVTGYNRPFLLQELFSHLLQIGIKKIYVSLDGPKNEQDFELCEQAYNIVNVNRKNFELKILRRDYNLGCCLGVVSALDWFFSEEDFGAIIEDDCIPSPSFFQFLSTALQNPVQEPLSQPKIFSAHNPFDYNFSGQLSNLVLIHGWATYSHVWKKIRENYFKLKLPSRVNSFGEKRKVQQSLYWWSNSTRAKLGLVDTWDGILNDQVWRLGLKTLIPKSNMVKNLGFGFSATHTTDQNQSNHVQLSHELLDRGNLDYLLNTFYFKIKRRHIVTALIRISIDIFRFKNRRNFENLLNQDLLSRRIYLP